MRDFIMTNYAGDVLGVSPYEASLWNRVHRLYSKDVIKECEIVVLSKQEYKRRFGDVQQEEM